MPGPIEKAYQKKQDSQKMSRRPMNVAPAILEERNDNVRDQDINLPVTANVMRAPTRGERYRDMAADFLDSVAQQPLVKALDAIGLSNISGQARDAVDPNAAYQMKQGIMLGGPPGLRGSAGFARQTKGAPAEFQAVSPNKYTVDPNEMPSGKMEYLDPDVAAYMNPEPMDLATREGQERLKFMLGGRR